MPILRMQHAVTSYDAWKRAFDSDPLDRPGNGVQGHRIHRMVADRDFVMIDLDFDGIPEAEAFLEKLRGLWAGPGRAVMQNPEAWIVETIESAERAPQRAGGPT